MKHKIIIDTDPGIDDAQAIAYAIAHPELELMALTTVFGNASVDVTTRNALSVLEKFDALGVEVARGASSPLRIERFPSPDFVHGVDGMGNLDIAPKQLAEHELGAAEYIVQAANQNLGELTVVAIGPLTNIAKALSLDPELPTKLKRLIVMGGTVSAPGNVSPVAEANFINDPHAADLVCSQNWPLSIVGLDVTMKIALTDSHFDELKQKAGSAGEFLWQSSRYYVDFYSSLPTPISNERACAMHDASALVFLTNPELFTMSKGVARVATSGVAMGQLISANSSEKYLLPHWQNLPDIDWAVQVESGQVLNCFLNTLVQYFKL